MKKSEERKAELLRLLEAGSTLAGAARACAISRETLRRWRAADPNFDLRVTLQLLRRHLRTFDTWMDRVEAELGI